MIILPAKKNKGAVECNPTVRTKLQERRKLPCSVKVSFIVSDPFTESIYDLRPSRMLWLLALRGMVAVGRESFGFAD